MRTETSGLSGKQNHNSSLSRDALAKAVWHLYFTSPFFWTVLMTASPSHDCNQDRLRFLQTIDRVLPQQRVRSNTAASCALRFCPCFFSFAPLAVAAAGSTGAFGVATSFSCTFKGNVPLPLPLPLALALRHLLEGSGKSSRWFLSPSPGRTPPSRET